MLRSPLRPLLRKPLQSPGGLAASSLINQLQRAVCDFTNGSSNPAVKITRSGLATTIGSDGTIQWGPHNLIGESQCDSGFAGSGTTPPTVSSFQQFAGESCTAVAFTSAMGIGYGNTRAERTVLGGSYQAAVATGRSYIPSNYLGLSRALTGSEQITVYWTGSGGTNAFYLTAANSAAFVGALARAPMALSLGTTGYIYPVIYLSGALTSNLTVYTNKGMLEDVTGTNRTTPSDYFDSTVKNRLGYPNDFTNAAWVNTSNSMNLQANSCKGPNGQPASTLTALVTSSGFYQSVSFTGICTSGIMVRRRSGTGAFSIRNSAATGWIQTPITTDWTLVQNDGGSATGTAYLNMNLATAGDQIDICDAQLNPGSTLWPYSYNPGAAPAVGPKYGLRTECDTSTVTGIGPDLLGGAGLFDLDAAAWTAVNNPGIVVSGGKVSITNNGNTYGAIYKAVPTVAGKAYVIKGDVVFGGGFARIESSNAVPNSVGGSGINVNTSGSFQSPPFVALGATTYIAVGNRNDNNATNTFDNITVQEAFAGVVAGYGPELASLPFAMRGTVAASTSTFTLTTTAPSGTYGVVVALPDQILPPGKTFLISANLVSKSTTDPAQSIVLYPGSGQNTGLWSYLFPLTASPTGRPFVPGSVATLTLRSEGGTAAIGDTFVVAISVKEIIFAPKGALIEPTQVTQLLANPDDLSATPWNGAITATNDGTRFRGRPMWKLTKPTSTPNEVKNNTTYSGAAGTYTQLFVFLASSTTSQADFGIFGNTIGWGADANCSAVILSGPGALGKALTGALFRLTGLSTNVPTFVAVTRTTLSADTIGPSIYPDLYTSTTIGKAIYVQVDNLVAGADGGGSFIPNPATSGTVTRLADDARVGFDDLAKALPWLMDTNIIPAAYVEDMSAWTKTAAGTGVLPVVTSNDTTYAAPDGTFTADKVVFNTAAGVAIGDESSLSVNGMTTVVGAQYTGTFRVMGATGTKLVFRNVAGSGYALVTCSGLGIWDTVPDRVEIAGTTSSNFSLGLRQSVQGTINATATVWLWGAKLNPGPIAQQYYPRPSKQGTIVFEGDLTYGPTGAVGVLSLENTTTNRVEIYKALGSNLLYGYVNANTTMGGVISSGAVFKAVVGFSPAAAGIVLNGAAEAAITPSAFAAAPNILKIGTDFAGNAASSMHVRRLRIFSQNLPASTKQSLTRLP